MAIRQPSGREPPRPRVVHCFCFYALSARRPHLAPSTGRRRGSGDEGLKNVARRMVARQREPQRYFAAPAGIFPETGFFA
jgi:hypothetical protein